MGIKCLIQEISFASGNRARPKYGEGCRGILLRLMQHLLPHWPNAY